MGRRTALVTVALSFGVAIPAASADVFKLFGEVHGGGLYGKGTAGHLKDSAFFDQAQGGAYGALVGAEVLFANLWIEHHQFVNSDGLKTWTKFGLGVHFSMDLGSPADTSPYFELGAGLWYGVGTGAQVMPPLDKMQVSDQGFLAEGRVGIGKHLSSIFDVGVVVPVSYGYFFRDTSGGAANDPLTHYRGFAVEGLLALRANLRIL